jgi:hypothetical protein
LPYQELLDKSDLVVIANATVRTADTTERCLLPDLGPDLPCIGVETPFKVLAVFKGERKLKSFTLHHYRVVYRGGIIGGPTLVFFDPSDPRVAGSYLLFLVREKDGRYAPTLGQMDPGFKVIIRLPFTEPTAPPPPPPPPKVH